MNGMTRLGGYQEAAEILSGLSGKKYSRQGVQQMFARRASNGFPDRHTYVINGRIKQLFRLQDVEDWFAFPEASAILTRLSGKIWVPSDVWKAWKDRDITGFPDRRQVSQDWVRLAFDEREITEWLREWQAQRRTTSSSGAA